MKLTTSNDRIYDMNDDLNDFSRDETRIFHQIKPP